MRSCARPMTVGSPALHRARQPVQNAFVENFNGRRRDELLNETLFRSLAHAGAAQGRTVAVGEEERMSEKMIAASKPKRRWATG